MNLREFHSNVWLTELVLDDFDVRGAVIIGQDRVVVWDTLSHPRDMWPVAELADQKPIYVVYSHADWDHCWGTAGLKSSLTIAHEMGGKRFEEGEVAEKLAEKQLKAPGKWDEVRLISPTLTFADSLSLDLGNLEVQLHHLPGHTEDCLVAFIPQLGVFLAGDTVETPLPYLSDNNAEVLSHWISGLQRWAEDDQIQKVIPAHGDIGDRTLIENNVTYLRSLHEGKTPDVPTQMSAFYTETHAQNLRLFNLLPPYRQGSVG